MEMLNAERNREIVLQIMHAEIMRNILQKEPPREPSGEGIGPKERMEN